MTFFLKQALGTTTVSCQSDNMLPYLEMSLKLYLVYMPLQAAIPQAHLCTRAKNDRCQSCEGDQISYRHSVTWGAMQAGSMIRYFQCCKTLCVLCTVLFLQCVRCQQGSQHVIPCEIQHWSTTEHVISRSQWHRPKPPTTMHELAGETHAAGQLPNLYLETH